MVSVAIGAALASPFKAVFGRAERAIDSLGSTIDSAANRQQRPGNVISRSMGCGSTHLGQMARRYRKMDKAIEKARRSVTVLNHVLLKYKVKSFR